MPESISCVRPGEPAFCAAGRLSRGEPTGRMDRVAPGEPTRHTLCVPSAFRSPDRGSRSGMIGRQLTMQARDTAVAVFDERDDAEDAISALRDAGFRADDIGLVA